MNSDVSKELLRKINKSFTLSYQKSEKVRKLLLAIKSKNCDYLKAMEYAEEVGKILAEAYMKNLSSDVLPDGKMYYDIASAILNPTLENNYGLISSYVCGAMDVMNEKAGINVKARKPSYNASKTLGLIKKVSDADHFDDVKKYLNEPVITNALSIVDDGARVNADFHYNLGYVPVIKRTASFGCCKWCRGLEGIVEYDPRMDRDIFRRHAHCRCKVIYDPGYSDGKVQDVYTKEWKSNIIELKREKTDNREGYHFISDKRFDQLTIRARKKGAFILRGTEVAENHLDKVNAAASIIDNIIFFRKDVCISEVLEETYHFEQNLRKQNYDKREPIKSILNEIDAKNYLLKNAKLYKIPRNEIELTKKQLEYYKKELQKEIGDD